MRLLAEIGGHAESELGMALEVLESGNRVLVQQLKDSDLELNQLDREVNDQCLQFLLQHSAMADDLRGVLCSTKISLHLERIGDYAKNIATRSLLIDRNASGPLLASLLRMGRQTLLSLSQALDSLGNRNGALAEKVWRQDAQIDAIYHSLFSDILSQINDRSLDPATGSHLLFMARNLERIGDHTGNIAEILVYWIKGKHIATLAKPANLQSDPASVKNAS